MNETQAWILASRFRGLVRAKGFRTGRQLAEKCPEPRPLPAEINAYLRGDRKPREGRLIEILKAIGATVDDLIKAEPILDRTRKRGRPPKSASDGRYNKRGRPRPTERKPRVSGDKVRKAFEESGLDEDEMAILTGLSKARVRNALVAVTVAPEIAERILRAAQDSKKGEE
jgi:transcriptional regulator with XRE-family HTH domain